MRNSDGKAAEVISLMVVGADGELGSAIYSYFSEVEGFAVFGTTRRSADLPSNFYFLDLENFRPFVLPYNLDAVVFCAGISGEEACKQDPDRSYRINVQATRDALAWLTKLGIFSIFLSSSCVFDGKDPSPTKDSTVSPRGLYGSHKSEIEQAFSDTDNVAVLRLTKVMTSNAAFMSDWEKKADSGSEINVYSDVLVSPISKYQVCEAVQLVLEQKKSGIFQLGAEKEYSYHDLAKKIFSGRPEVLENLRPTQRNANGALEYNSLKTQLPIQLSKN